MCCVFALADPKSIVKRASFICVCLSQEDINRSSSLAQHADASGSQQHVVLGENSPGYTADGEIISSQTVSSKTRTVETITVSRT